MEIEGHIKKYQSEETLCGTILPVRETGLYGKTCGECCEVARKILQGEKTQ